MANKTLYVGNLPYSVSEQQLTDHFKSYGSTNARIVEGRGFGFVDVDSANAEAAIADKNNTQLDGRTLVVNEARPKSEGGGNRSGGGGGGGGNYSSSSGGRSKGNRW